jgi:hypothetical protein
LLHGGIFDNLSAPRYGNPPLCHRPDAQYESINQYCEVSIADMPLFSPRLKAFTTAVARKLRRQTRQINQPCAGTATAQAIIKCLD